MTPSKPELRATMKAALAAIPAHQRAAASQRVCDSIAALPEFQSARTIALYAPLPTELDVLPLAAAAIAHGKTVAVPRTNWATRTLDFSPIASADLNTLILGRLGLREPGPHAPALGLAAIDLLIVPGLAFDPRGRRLGRGAGFYDRLLAHPDLRALTIGVGFDEQLVDEVPVDAHDHRVAQVCTPSGTRRTKLLDPAGP